MNQELERIAGKLSRATKPEDVFGEMRGPDPLAELRRAYHALAKAAHPDVYSSAEDKALAGAAFAQLSAWFEDAEAKVKAGTYGRKDWAVLRTPVREYEVETAFGQDGQFNYYPCRFREAGPFDRLTVRAANTGGTQVRDGRAGVTREAVLRIVRDPRDNDLVRNEIRILRILDGSPQADKFRPYIPNLLDAFLYQDRTIPLAAAVFERYDGWYSLEDVHRAYPRGVDPKDAAWMWRRLLVALGFAHANGIVHGAVLPHNVWIQPEGHGLMLAGWFDAALPSAPACRRCAARTVSEVEGRPPHTGEVVSDLDPRFLAWYPREIVDGEAPTYSADVGMSAKCMIHLLGGDVDRRTIPDSVPRPMRMFLKGSSRSNDAWALKQEFDDLLERLWGQRRFHPFTMASPINPKEA